MAANSAVARDIAYQVHPQTNLKRHREEGPLVLTRGEGVYVYDEEGRRYLEAMSGLWCASLGFSETRLADAAYAQLKTLPYYHTFNGRAHPMCIDLAEKLVEIAPVKMSKVLFQSSGSEANDTAIKLAWYYHNATGRPEKKKIIGRMKGYHGTTVASVSLSGQPLMHTDFDLPLPGFKHAGYPHYYKFGRKGESEEEFAGRMAQNLEDLILAEGPETCAAFFAEPVQGAGGVIVPPRTYFEKVQAILKKHEILFVADEVICGFGRTGDMWGCETYDLEPDMLTCAKALSGAYMPISALMISEEMYEAMVEESEKIGVFGHGFTYSGHPVTAAVALETLKLYEERDILGHVRAVAPAFQERMAAFAGHPLVGDVSGVGLLAGLEIVQDKETREGFDEEVKAAERIQRRALEHGVVTRALGDRLALCPPLIIEEAHVDEMAGAVQRALDEVLAELREEGIAAAG